VPGSENFRLLIIKKKQDIFTEYNTPVFTGITKLSCLFARFGVSMGFEKSIPGIEIFSLASIVIFPIIF
jgi:hypothetical protein